MRSAKMGTRFPGEVGERAGSMFTVSVALPSSESQVGDICFSPATWPDQPAGRSCGARGRDAREQNGVSTEHI